MLTAVAEAPSTLTLTLPLLEAFSMTMATVWLGLVVAIL